MANILFDYNTYSFKLLEGWDIHILVFFVNYNILFMIIVRVRKYSNKKS